MTSSLRQTTDPRWDLRFFSTWTRIHRVLYIKNSMCQLNSSSPIRCTLRVPLVVLTIVSFKNLLWLWSLKVGPSGKVWWSPGQLLLVTESLGGGTSLVLWRTSMKPLLLFPVLRKDSFTIVDPTNLLIYSHIYTIIKLYVFHHKWQKNGLVQSDFGLNVLKKFTLRYSYEQYLSDSIGVDRD